MTHVKYKEIFLRENVAQVAFRSIMSTGIVCSEFSIVYYFSDQNRGILVTACNLSIAADSVLFGLSGYLRNKTIILFI